MQEHMGLINIAFPALIAVIAFAVMWGGVVVRMKFFGDDIKELKEEKLDEKVHKLLCKNSTLQFKSHVTNELIAFEESILPKIKKIVNGG